MIFKMLKRGAFALAPITITLALLIWFFSFMEDLFRPPIKLVLGTHYIPGMGVLLALIIILIIGAVLNTWITKKLVIYWERIVKKIPILKTVYFKVQDIFQFIAPEKEKESGKVVKVNFHGVEQIGIVSQDMLDHDKLGTTDHVAIYFPMSYQMGGYMALVPRKAATPINMTIKEAIEFVITAGAKKIQKKIP